MKMAPSALIMVTLFMAISILALPMMASSQRVPADRPYQNDLEDPVQKRPFCNAFSGCGKKRALPPQEMFVPFMPKYGKTFSSELENSENLAETPMEQNVDEIARQILAEAKLMEAIQKVGRDIYRQRLATAGSK